MGALLDFGEGPALFAGDTNLREAEVKQEKLTKQVRKGRSWRCLLRADAAQCCSNAPAREICLSVALHLHASVSLSLSLFAMPSAFPWHLTLSFVTSLLLEYVPGSCSSTLSPCVYVCVYLLPSPSFPSSNAVRVMLSAWYAHRVVA